MLHLSLRVDVADPPGRFAWVIVEWRPDGEEIELAMSLDTYARPSGAMRAGELVLAALYPLPAAAEGL